MQNMISFSVVVPIYNTASFLRQCLNSILYQSFDNVELICVDDGSTDESRDILRKYAAQDERVQLVFQKNAGVSVARNNGLKKAKGKYVYFLDSDDYLRQDALELIFAEMEKKQLDILHFAAKRIDENGFECSTEKNFLLPFLKNNQAGQVFHAADIEPFLFQMSVNPGLSVFKRSFLLKHRILFPEGIRFEDNLFHFQSFLLASKIGFLKDQLYYYRSVSTSVTGCCDERLCYLVDVYQLIESFLKSEKTWNRLKNDFLLRQFDRLIHAYTSIQPQHKMVLHKKLVTHFKHLALTDAEVKELPLKNQLFYHFILSKSSKPVMSFIIPTFQARDFLPRLYSSLNAQSVVNFEVLLLDMDSTDGSAEFIKQLVKKDNRFVLSSSPLDLKRARQKGLENASGKYVCFMDSFDMIDWRFVERTTSETDKMGADILLFPFDVILSDGQKVKSSEWFDTNKKGLIKPADMNAAFLQKGRLFNKVFRRSFLKGGMFSSSIQVEDTVFWKRCCSQSVGIGVLNWNIYSHQLLEHRAYFKETAIDFPKTTEKVKQMPLWKRVLFFPRAVVRLHRRAVEEMNAQTPAFILICDTAFVFPTAVTIQSLIQSKKSQSKYRVFVIGVNLDKEAVDALESLSQSDVMVRVIKQQNKYEKESAVRNFVTPAALFKFDLPQIFGRYKRILYLDSDIIVTRDLSSLFLLENFEQVAGAVVKDMVAMQFNKEHKSLGLPAYFNSGVLMLNLRWMRQNRATDLLLSHKKNDKRLLFMDQDAFNVVFNKHVIYLSPDYNFMQCNFLLKDRQIARFYEMNDQDFKKIKQLPAIIHYSSKAKPWLAKTPYLDLWDETFKQVYDGFSRKYPHAAFFKRMVGKINQRDEMIL